MWHYQRVRVTSPFLWLAWGSVSSAGTLNSGLWLRLLKGLQDWGGFFAPWQQLCPRLLFVSWSVFRLSRSFVLLLMLLFPNPKALSQWTDWIPWLLAILSWSWTVEEWVQWDCFQLSLSFGLNNKHPVGFFKYMYTDRLFYLFIIYFLAHWRIKKKFLKKPKPELHRPSYFCLSKMRAFQNGSISSGRWNLIQGFVNPIQHLYKSCLPLD